MLSHGTLFTAYPNQIGQPNQHAPPETKEKEKLENLLETSNVPLIKISSVFPFDFFPDTIIVDATKVNIVIREFFGSEQIYSIPITNIAQVYTETGPFFATLRILPQRVFQHQIIEVDTLWRDDALELRDVIQGLIVAIKENIDIALVPKEESRKKLKNELQKLGKIQPY